ncbi:homoserine kinase [Alicyclobacillaceae bacterium I2511]|nr:homoserine kinase [Alicyclobacillaceae bacterium I2511]
MIQSPSTQLGTNPGAQAVNPIDELPRMRVRVPATTANLGPGFDSMGLALDLFNTVELYLNRSFTVTIHGESARLLPTDRSNVIVHTIDIVLEQSGTSKVPHNWDLHLDNQVPVASGLGSSATAIVSGLMLGNALLQHFDPARAYGENKLLAMAVDLEGHPDNVTPAMLGGAWLSVTEGGGPRSFPLPLPERLCFAVAVPNFPLRTEDARRVLPSHVPLTDAAANSAQAARLVLALSQDKLDWLRGSFRDYLHEQYRQNLIPGFVAVRKAALRAGALTTTLSGAGPTLLAWCDSNQIATQVADAMTLAWRESNVECATFVSRPSCTHPKVEFLGFPRSPVLD